jgi:hypothetical protein
MPGVRRSGGAAHHRQLGRSPRCRRIRAWDESRVTDSDEEVVITQTWGEIRRFMWNLSASSAPPSGWSGPSAGSTCSGRRSPTIISPLPRDAGPDRIAQPGRGRRPDHPLGARRGTKAAGCITRSIIRVSRGSEKRSSDAIQLRPFQREQASRFGATIATSISSTGRATSSAPITGCRR